MHITNIISRYFQKFAEFEFPYCIQRIINLSYVKILGLNMIEFKNPKHYKSLNKLFTRELELNRRIDETKSNIISPCDSFVTQCGTLKEDTALQIKGMEYSVEELLTYYAKENISKIKNGLYINFYLSPKDYHRYHSPFDMQIKKAIHIPGKLYPVNLKYLNKEIGLFVQNERVVLECSSNGSVFYLVFVGALNVGKMVFSFENKIETNTSTQEIKLYEYEDLEIKKGDYLGHFKMGSTILLFCQKDSVNLEDLINQNVKFGQKIAEFTKGATNDNK